MVSLKCSTCIFLQCVCQIVYVNCPMRLKLCTSFQNWVSTFCISAHHKFSNRKIVEYCINTMSSLCLDITSHMLYDITLSVWWSNLGEKAHYDRIYNLYVRNTQASDIKLIPFPSIFIPLIFVFLFGLFVFLNTKQRHNEDKRHSLYILTRLPLKYSLPWCVPVWKSKTVLIVSLPRASPFKSSDSVI